MKNKHAKRLLLLLAKDNRHSYEEYYNSTENFTEICIGGWYSGYVERSLGPDIFDYRHVLECYLGYMKNIPINTIGGIKVRN